MKTNHSGGIGSHDLCIARADVLPQDHLASPWHRDVHVRVKTKLGFYPSVKITLLHVCKFIINGLIVDIKLETNDSRVENLHGWHGVMRCSYMLQKETYKSARDAKMIRHQLFFSEPQELKRLFQYGTKQQHSEYQSGTSSAKACILCIFSQLIYLIYMTMNAIPE